MMDKAPVSSHVLCSSRQNRLFSAVVLPEAFFFPFRKKGVLIVCIREDFNYSLSLHFKPDKIGYGFKLSLEYKTRSSFWLYRTF